MSLSDSVSLRSPSLPYVVPFGVFVALLVVRPFLLLSDLSDQILRGVILLLVVALFSRPVLDFRIRRAVGSIVIGVGVFLIWVGPDVLFPGYRGHWLFSNPITGTVHGSLSVASHGNAAVLALRCFRAVAIVPVVEELFWRAWMMRWLIARDFRSVPLGAYTRQSFWIVAVLFASEHGPFWDVGLMAGIVYNWWMLRARSLGDLILVHAVTNACLSAYVLIAGKWEYWL